MLKRSLTWQSYFRPKIHVHYSIAQNNRWEELNLNIVGSEKETRTIGTDKRARLTLEAKKLAFVMFPRRHHTIPFSDIVDVANKKTFSIFLGKGKAAHPLLVGVMAFPI